VVFSVWCCCNVREPPPHKNFTRRAHLHTHSRLQHITLFDLEGAVCTKALLALSPSAPGLVSVTLLGAYSPIPCAPWLALLCDRSLSYLNLGARSNELEDSHCCNLQDGDMAHLVAALDQLALQQTQEGEDEEEEPHNSCPSSTSPLLAPTLRQTVGRSWRSVRRYQNVRIDPCFPTFGEGALADFATSIYSRAMGTACSKAER
jgi:hypothetical protein